MTSVDDLVARAVTAAEKAPDALREVTFSEVFRYLSGQGAGFEPAASTSASKSRKAKEPQGDPLADFDRTKLGELNDDTPALERALSVLRQARDDHAVDDLTAPQIADLLTKTVRIRTSRTTISTALDNAVTLVSRRKVGNKVLYSIMGAGETYLDDPQARDKLKSKPARKSSSKAKSAARSSPKAKSNSSPGKSAKNSAAKSGGRPGPQTALRGLIDAGYFAQPRAIQDAQKRLEQSRGYRYKQNELSGPLVRLLRKGLLQREMKGDQYEYSTP
ncbi:MAG: hypothetical protein QOF51_1445 [Chloroflexota bacterium]|jgi:hypothetical protein|nr:hypothetical protein [Chloroflexota bacterium]